MKWTEFESKQSWHYWGTIPAFTWWEWWKLWKPEI